MEQMKAGIQSTFGLPSSAFWHEAAAAWRKRCLWLCTKAPSNCQACNLEAVSSQRGHVFLTHTRILHRLEKNDVPCDNLATFSFFILYILKLISLSGILLKFYKHCVIWFSQQPTITSILLQHTQSNRILSGRVSIWT